MIPISVCIITKNEASNLEKCLQSLKDYPFEIIVVDTGSTDNSKEIASQYADKVLDFEWCDDFSAARKFSISKASHNMILVLDTDEYITDLEQDMLDELIEQNPTGIGLIERLDYFDVGNMRRAQVSRIDRLFNRKYYRYTGRIHECLTAIGNTPYSTYEIPLTADHTGYLGTQEELDQKALRDIMLLQKEVAEDSDNPYLYFQIGQSYLLMRDDKHACDYFTQAMKLTPNPADDYTRILIKNYGGVLMTLGQEEKALDLLAYYDDYKDNADYLCMIGTIYLQLNQPLKALPEFIKALTAPQYDSIDSRKCIPSFYIGHIYQAFGQIDIAKTHYKNCGDYPPALERLSMLE